MERSEGEHLAPRPDLLAGGRDLVSRLTEWVAGARADEVAEGRRREGFLRRTAGEGATFAGVLVDLAERGSPVLLTLSGGRQHRGTLLGVGADFVALRAGDGRQVLVSHAGIVAVRPDDRAAAASGDRRATLPLGLAEALAVLAEDRPRVLVTAIGEQQGLAGELRSCGLDVLVLRLDGAGRPTAYVPMANLVEVSIA